MSDAHFFTFPFENTILDMALDTALSGSHMNQINCFSQKLLVTPLIANTVPCKKKQNKSATALRRTKFIQQPQTSNRKHWPLGLFFLLFSVIYRMFTLKLLIC